MQNLPFKYLLQNIPNLLPRRRCREYRAKPSARLAVMHEALADGLCRTTAALILGVELLEPATVLRRAELVFYGDAGHLGACQHRGVFGEPESKPPSRRGN